MHHEKRSDNFSERDSATVIEFENNDFSYRTVFSFFQTIEYKAFPFENNVALIEQTNWKKFQEEHLQTDGQLFILGAKLDSSSEFDAMAVVKREKGTLLLHLLASRKQGRGLAKVLLQSILSKFPHAVLVAKSVLSYRTLTAYARLRFGLATETQHAQTPQQALQILVDVMKNFEGLGGPEEEDDDDDGENSEREDSEEEEEGEDEESEGGDDSEERKMTKAKTRMLPARTTRGETTIQTRARRRRSKRSERCVSCHNCVVPCSGGWCRASRDDAKFP